METTALVTTKLSYEQLDVANYVDTGEGNFIVRARAGTGKTFLILQCLGMMKGNIAILAYGKEIAAEIRAKVAKAGHRGVDVSTFHSVGAKVLGKIFREAKIEGRGKGEAGYYKFDRIAEELNIPKYLQAFVKRVMGMAMLHGAGIPGLMSAKDINEWQNLVTHYGIMLWVGDDFQSIFGFTGSSIDSLDVIEREFNCKVFPMTQTFRCGKAIVSLARRLVPDYKAAPDNHDGEVSTISEKNFKKLDLVPGQDAVICRNTRPLIPVAYDLIKRGIPAHIEGKDIGKGLLSLTNRWQGVKTIPALVTRLTEYRDKEVSKLMLAKQELQAEALSDKVDTVLAIIEGLPKGATLNDLRERIDSMFANSDGEKAATVVLMTAHRSKGREFHTVYGLGVSSLMPSKRAKQDWEIQQERNLEYVLYTRSIHRYIDVVLGD